MGGQLLAEPLGTLFLAGGVAARWPPGAGRDAAMLVLAGVLLGATVLTRTDLILVPAILAVLTAWFLRARPPGRAALRRRSLAGVRDPHHAALGGGGGSQAGHFVPVTEGDGAALFVGTYLPGKGTTLGFKRAVVAETRAKHPRFKNIAPYYIPASIVLADQAKKRPGSTRTPRCAPRPRTT